MKKLLVTIILLLAILLRFYDLRNNPPGVYVDEATQGYNAYSLSETGRDEYGKPYPIFLKSFGIYLSALYTNVTVLPVKAFGPSAFSTRFVSAASGVLLVVLSIKYLGLVEALVIAITPIFVFMSRGAFETNFALLLFMFGFFLSIKARGNKKLLLPGFLFLGLSSYAYRTEQLLAPFFLFYFSFAYWKDKQKRKLIIPALILTSLLLIPLLLTSLTPGPNTRTSGLLLNAPLIQKVSYFIRHYLAYFSPNNLFSKPDPDLQRSFPDLSVFYWWMIVPFFLGLKSLFKNKPLLTLALVSPIPGALTLDYFSTFRALPLFMVFTVSVATGLKSLFKNRPYLFVLLVLIAVTELYSNLILLKHERSTVWNYEYKALAEFVKENPAKHLVIDNSRQKPVKTLLQFHNKMDPKKFQTTNVEDYYTNTFYDPNQSFDNLEIRSIYWKEDVYKNQIIIADTLAISDKQAEEHKLTLLKIIPDINGVAVLRIFQTNPEAKKRGIVVY